MFTRKLIKQYKKSMFKTAYWCLFTVGTGISNHKVHYFLIPLHFGMMINFVIIFSIGMGNYCVRVQ